MHKDLIVIGTSMGGIEALKTLVSGLPADLPASICIVLHVGAYGIGLLPQILQSAGPLPAVNARDRIELEPGHIYVAPPDQHVLVDQRGRLRLSRGPKENRCRPAIDPLFRSAAVTYGERVIGVVLTGWLDDGTAGLWAVKERGGTAIVQDPNDALAPDMPLNALKHVQTDYCVPLREIAPLLSRLTRVEVEPKPTNPVSKQMESEARIALEDQALEAGVLEWGEPSVFACPECHGVLMQLKEGSNVRFRCHTGHCYSIETLLAEFNEATEETLWSALRAVEEQILLLERMAAELESHQHADAAATLRREAREAHRRSHVVRSAIMNDEPALGGTRVEQSQNSAASH